MTAILEMIDTCIKRSSSRLEFWQHLVGGVGARSMLEIGVWKGEFAEHVLRHCSSIERYFMIDPWANLPDWNKPFNVESEVFKSIYNEAMGRTAFAADRVVTLRGRTKEVIDEIPDRSLDVVYIDGDHTLRGITIDLIRAFPKVKDGGIIGGDDFTNTPWQHGVQFEPTLVCPYSVYFAEAMDLPIVALPYGQFVISKDRKGGFSFIDAAGTYGDISLNKRSAL